VIYVIIHGLPPADVPQYLGDIHIHRTGINAAPAACACNWPIMQWEIMEFTIEAVTQALIFHITWIMPACHTPVGDAIAGIPATDTFGLIMTITTR
jgi:hypothetical protein